MGFKIKKYPSSRVKRLPIKGFGQGAKDITRGTKVHKASGGYSPPDDIEAPSAVVINGVLSGVIGTVAVVNGVLTNE